MQTAEIELKSKIKLAKEQMEKISLTQQRCIVAEKLASEKSELAQELGLSTQQKVIHYNLKKTENKLKDEATKVRLRKHFKEYNLFLDKVVLQYIPNVAKCIGVIIVGRIVLPIVGAILLGLFVEYIGATELAGGETYPNKWGVLSGFFIWILGIVGVVVGNVIFYQEYGLVFNKLICDPINNYNRELPMSALLKIQELKDIRDETGEKIFKGFAIVDLERERWKMPVFSDPILLGITQQDKTFEIMRWDYREKEKEKV